jgi:hypothetical protein
MIFQNLFTVAETLSYTKKGSIKKHIEYSFWTWHKWKTKGWKCIQVEVEIKPIYKKHVKNKK